MAFLYTFTGLWGVISEVLKAVIFAFFRLANTDSIQYFQFDCHGNMYIYAPSAGCTGQAKFVAPGDDLIFSNSTQWEAHDSQLLSDVVAKEQKGLASTCPAGEPSRPFHTPLPEHDLKELSYKNFSLETLKKVQWVTKMYREWRLYHQYDGQESIVCDLDDKATITAMSLCFALCCFLKKN